VKLKKITVQLFAYITNSFEHRQPDILKASPLTC
jgi:hypothetical protein